MVTHLQDLVGLIPCREGCCLVLHLNTAAPPLSHLHTVITSPSKADSLTYLLKHRLQAVLWSTEPLTQHLQAGFDLHGKKVTRAASVSKERKAPIRLLLITGPITRD